MQTVSGSAIKKAHLQSSVLRVDEKIELWILPGRAT